MEKQHYSLFKAVFLFVLASFFLALAIVIVMNGHVTWSDPFVSDLDVTPETHPYRFWIGNLLVLGASIFGFWKGVCEFHGYRHEQSSRHHRTNAKSADRL
jgi:hypothetical protein